MRTIHLGDFMKILIATIALLTLSSSYAKLQRGDMGYENVKSVQGHILFQADSTYVNAYYNKTLCLDGDTYKAVVSKCLEWGTPFRNGQRNRRSHDSVCLKRGKVMISQPEVSTRQRCAAYDNETPFNRGDHRAHNGRCIKWETVPFVQSPDMTIKFFNQDNTLIKTEEITVPSC